MHSCGENYWKAMKGDKEKKRTCNKKNKNTIPSITLMGGDQTKNEVGYKEEQETATKNITASGAGAEDFQHFFIRNIAKGSKTKLVLAGKPPLCKLEG